MTLLLPRLQTPESGIRLTSTGSKLLAWQEKEMSVLASFLAWQENEMSVLTLISPPKLLSQSPLRLPSDQRAVISGHHMPAQRSNTSEKFAE